MEESQRRWVDSMPEVYERVLGPAVFRPFAIELAQRVSAPSPHRVLELAAGTGVLTRELLAVLPSAEVTATDLNPAMVRFGRERVPAARWEEADATDLPFPDGRFDLVACQFGVMFFPDKPATFQEVRRVLRPGGAFFFNVWATLDGHDFEAAVVAGLRRALPVDRPTFLEAVPHGYADVARVVTDLQLGGFTGIEVEPVTLEGCSGSAAEIAEGYCYGTPLRTGIEARGDLAAVAAVVAQEIEARLGPGPVTGGMTAHVVQAIGHSGSDRAAD